MESSPRPPLRRARTRRILGGVCAGLAEHLNLNVATIRLVMVGAVFLGGFGIIVYLWLWLTVPRVDRSEDSFRLAPRLETGLKAIDWSDAVMGVVILGIAITGFVVLRVSRIPWWVTPVALIGLGVILAWAQLGRVNSVNQTRPRSVTIGLVVGALALVLAGILVWIGRGREPLSMVYGTLAGLAMVAGVVVVLAPWWLRLLQTLGTERAARARESERADIAAHLHDSVLQTLTLIRASADNPTAVRTMARSQERELRDWLYRDRKAPAASVAEQLRQVCAEVEDQSGKAIELVVVGDRIPDGDEPLIPATREAVLNATRHGAPPVSVYAEIGDPTQVYVRDRGEGFDVEAIPDDRMGVRGSIIGRMERAGGEATITRMEQGTEVHIVARRSGKESKDD